MRRRIRSLLAILAALGIPVLVLAGTGSGTNYTVTPWMGLTLPIPGVTGALGIEPPGKSWMELQGASFYLLDGHNHAPGSGLPVPSSGLNINADVPWNSNNVTQLRSARFTPLTLGSLTASDVGALVVAGADLYFVDTASNQVRLTASGALAGTPGSISGLVSPAAATYTPASKLFTWTSSSGFAANMSQGPTSVCDATVSGGKCGTLQAPAGLAANYSLTLPTALPAATKPVTISSTGALAPADTFTVTGAIAAGSLSSSGTLASTGNATVGGTLTVTGATTLSGGLSGQVTRANLPTVGQQVSGLSAGGTFNTYSTTPVDVTNLSITITTSGRPVILMLQGDAGGPSSIVSTSNVSDTSAVFLLLRGSTILTQVQPRVYASSATTGTTIQVPPASLTFIDVVAAGTYTYKVQAQAGTGSGAQAIVSNCRLVAYEL